VRCHSFKKNFTLRFCYSYFAPDEGAKYCCEHVCISVCLFICLSHMSKKPHVQASQNFLYMLRVTMAEPFSDDNAIRYALPVLWMTSCFPIVGHMAHVIGIYVGTVLQQVVINCQRICQGAPCCLTVIIYSGGKLHTRGELCCLRLPCCVCYCHCYTNVVNLKFF